jgi:hypothetical protein
MTRARLAIHGHFYQPDRRDPFSGEIPPDPSAAPARDWTARIAAECYRPNAERGNFGRIGWDLGPALAGWLLEHEPEVHAAIVRQDDGANGMAVAYNHSILPLAPARDRRTEIRWGLRDFEQRFGRRATGLWLPEAAVDRLTIEIAAEEGVEYTILAPRQAEPAREQPERAEPGAAGDGGRGVGALDPRRPYRVDAGGGRAIAVVLFDELLSTGLSFDPTASVDADAFSRERVPPRAEPALTDGASPLLVVATDGELYGHHQQFREMFLERLTTAALSGGLGAPDPAFGLTTVGAALRELPLEELPAAAIRERTSWSCHHGVARWSTECPDAADGRWKQPLRSALDRLAAAIDAVTEIVLAPLGVDAWAARDAYVDVVSGFSPVDALAARTLAAAVDGAPALAARIAADAGAEALLRDLMAAQASRLAMFASDAWFWEDASRPETQQAMRFAAHAARLVDPLVTGARGGRIGPLERALVEDLRALRSPLTGEDGAALYRVALAIVGQPAPA